MKLTEYTYGCNSLTNFEFEADAKTGNGNLSNLLKLATKNREIKSSKLIFGGI